MDRPQYNKLKDTLRLGDTLFVTTLDRFSRTTLDGLLAIRDLEEKQIEFVSPDFPFGGSPKFRPIFVALLLYVAEMEQLNRKRRSVRVATWSQGSTQWSHRWRKRSSHRWWKRPLPRTRGCHPKLKSKDFKVHV